MCVLRVHSVLLCGGLLRVMANVPFLVLARCPICPLSIMSYQSSTVLISGVMGPVPLKLVALKILVSICNLTSFCFDAVNHRRVYEINFFVHWALLVSTHNSCHLSSVTLRSSLLMMILLLSWLRYYWIVFIPWPVDELKAFSLGPRLPC